MCQLVSDVGNLRTNNEDMVLLNGAFYRDAVADEFFSVDESFRLTAFIADGMGGTKCGEVASEQALRAIDAFVCALPSELSTEELKSKVDAWAKETHLSIVNAGEVHTECKGMGTTLVGILSYEGRVYMLNIGDSRLYRFRNGILKQLTTDHSMRELTGKASVPSNLIYNSLGAGTTVFADFTDLTDQIYPDDTFLLCSDGLSDMLSDEQIVQVLSSTPTAQHLVQAAKAAGGKDNVSVMLCSWLSVPN
jgi:protein phosphatase